MRIAIGTDHRGYAFKEELKATLKSWGHSVTDQGTDSAEACDYPDLAVKVAEDVAQGRADLGVLICGTGHGMSIAANKVPGVRAVTAYDDNTALMAKEHNNANVLVLPGSLIDPKRGAALAKVFLDAKFEGGRHSTRLAKITEIERKYLK